MGRMYSASFAGVAVTAQQDFFEIVAPADSVVVIHGWSISQSSDAGDAQSEQLRVDVTRASTSGSGGSTPTPIPLEVGMPAFGGTCEANNTTPGTAGVVLDARCFNVMAGIEVVYTPETRLVLSPAGRVCISLLTTPADSLTMSGVVFFEEIGG